MGYSAPLDPLLLSTHGSNGLGCRGPGHCPCSTGLFQSQEPVLLALWLMTTYPASAKTQYLKFHPGSIAYRKYVPFPISTLHCIIPIVHLHAQALTVDARQGTYIQDVEPRCYCRVASTAHTARPRWSASSQLRRVGDDPDPGFDGPA